MLAVGYIRYRTYLCSHGPEEDRPAQQHSTRCSRVRDYGRPRCRPVVSGFTLSPNPIVAGSAITFASTCDPAQGGSVFIGTAASTALGGQGPTPLPVPAIPGHSRSRPAPNRAPITRP